MVGIIVVFPNKDNATNIRNLLVRAGLNVTGVCTTGAQAMNYADSVDEGIIVCGYKLKDKDKIEWVYTCDLGKDVGDDYQEKAKKQMEQLKESDKNKDQTVEKEGEAE